MRVHSEDSQGSRHPTPLVEVRRMTQADLEDVMAVERLAFKNPWSAELFRRELMHDWSTVLLSVRPTRQPAEPPPSAAPPVLGFVIFWLVHDEVHVLNLATHPDSRRQGIGRLLMLEAIERGRQNGATLVTLEVRRSNHAALDLYRDLGFRPVGIRPNYYVDEGEDAVVMILDL